MKDERGIVKAAAVAVLLTLAVVMGVWITVHEDEHVKVEVRLNDAVVGTESAVVDATLRVTSKIDKDVQVHNIRLDIYTDDSMEKLVLSKTDGHFVIPAHGVIERTYHEKLDHINELGSSVYVVFEMSHYAEGEWGDVHTHEARTIDLNDIWEQL